METNDLVVIDIETLPTTSPAKLEEIKREAFERQPAQNVKVEIKQAWKTDAARSARSREAMEKTAVDLLWAEVACIGMHIGDQTRYLGPTEYLTERETLIALAECLGQKSNESTVWIGHNIGFDLAVLLNRFRHYRIAPPKHFPVFSSGHWRGRVYDTMRRTPCANGLGYVGLSEVCMAYGLPPAKGIMWEGFAMDGSRVYSAWKAEAWDTLREYCLSDVGATLQLYEVQTAGATWGTFGIDDLLYARCREIWAGPGEDTAKRLTVFSLLDQHGRIPR